LRRGSDDTLRNAAQIAIKAFSTNLPFGFEEEMKNEENVKSLRPTAEIWAELGPWRPPRKTEML
jgi:hypothetical protein